MNVFPVREESKAPAVKGWAERAAPLADWLEAPEWRDHRRWGAPCGHRNGFWVLDVDPRHGGVESLLLLEQTYGSLGHTYSVRTPSGGWHYYFRWVDACTLLTNTAGKLGPGLDIRAEGGMILVPPSEGYEAMSNSEPAEAPAWLLALLMPAPKASAGPQTLHSGDAPIRNPRQWGARAIASAIEEIKAAPLGSRDATMNRNAYGIGRVVVACNLNRDAVMDLLVTTAIDAGYDAHKALDCCQRAVDAGMQNPREVSAPAEAGAILAGAPQRPLTPPVLAAGGNIQLSPCPPKPGKEPADLDSAAGRRWLEAVEAYREWRRTFREHCDAKLVVVQYGDGRVLFRRHGLRRLKLLGARDVQCGEVRAIGEEAGLLVSREMGDATVQDYLGKAQAVTVYPTLWDTGDGFYFYEQPKVEAGPTPTWDTIIDRLSDPDAFLAHVWSAFEPKYAGRQVLWLQGGGNDGKSIALDALLEGAGIEMASISDGDLGAGNQFVFSSIWNKPVVVVSESKSVNVMMTGMMHKLTGRDAQPVEYKFGSRFSARFQGVVFVTSNNKPQIEKTRSNLTRLTVVTISPLVTFVPNLHRRLRDEVPALLARAREAYARLCPDHFTIGLSERSKGMLLEATAHEEAKYASAFKHSGLQFKEEAFVSRRDIVAQLLACKSPMAEDNKIAGFYRWLKEQPGVQASSRKGVRGFRGVSL